MAYSELRSTSAQLSGEAVRWRDSGEPGAWRPRKELVGSLMRVPEELHPGDTAVWDSHGCIWWLLHPHLQSRKTSRQGGPGEELPPPLSLPFLSHGLFVCLFVSIYVLLPQKAWGCFCSLQEFLIASPWLSLSLYSSGTLVAPHWKGLPYSGSMDGACGSAAGLPQFKPLFHHVPAV